MKESTTAVAFTVSYRCPIECEHCIVGAGPREGKIIDFRTVDKVLDEAQPNGINNVLIYGGEPFLFLDSALPKLMNQALSKGFDVAINSNGFWGEDEATALKSMQDIQEIGERYGKEIFISLSVDQYHQAQIPVDAIANIIAQHKLNKFPNIELGLATLRGSKNMRVIDDLARACLDRDIYLLRKRFYLYKNHKIGIYAATKDEVIDYDIERHKELVKATGSPDETPYDSIDPSTKAGFEIEEGKIAHLSLRYFMFEVMTDGKLCITFPDEKHFMGLYTGTLIHAGRSEEGIPVRLKGKIMHTLFIDPHGDAYSCPAEMRTGKGISLTGKSLHEVISEAKEAFKK
jgi:MoaA/NifB/PqqE/SkfB family radical SAM enzyme